MKLTSQVNRQNRMITQIEAQSIYRDKINEVFNRLEACEFFLKTDDLPNNKHMVDAAFLQLRKALEALAYAAIAPNRKEYESFRACSEACSDFRKDYNARTILQHLKKINPDFYPIALVAPEKSEDNTWYLTPKKSGTLTLKEFERAYDRLGKFLHADNPWGNDKGLNNLIKDIPTIIQRTRNLLEIHHIVIRTPDFIEGWAVALNRGKVVKFLTIKYEENGWGRIARID